jgi:hypothetical protein
MLVQVVIRCSQRQRQRSAPTARKTSRIRYSSPRPAAQRPGVAKMADRLLDQCPQPGLEAVVGSLPVGELVFGAPVTTGACQCARALARPRNPRSSRLTTSTSSSALSNPEPAPVSRTLPICLGRCC